MTRELLPLPEPCAAALEAVQRDPLAPGRPAEIHLRTCPACAEARVLLLAQEESPDILAPREYHDRLPARILGKLPQRKPASHAALHRLLWAAAAVLLMAVGAGAFWVGRANRTPLVEAHAPTPVDTVEITVPDTPFRDRDEDAVQLQSLSPEEMQALLKRMDEPAPTQRQP